MKKIMLLMVFALSVLMCSVQKDENEEKASEDSSENQAE